MGTTTTTTTTATTDEPRELTAGPLRALFADGDLRYLRVGWGEFLRRIYVAVRDERWGTVPPVLSNFRVEQCDDGFDVAYDARHQRGDVDFGWHATIRARATGAWTRDTRVELSFEMDGVAGSTFRTCRTGFCVLHPPDLTGDDLGTRCDVEHADGARTESSFPTLISPHQPFKDVRALTVFVDDGVAATIRFDGEVFETEDQRNWTDGSFKTYCRPLALPFPYTLERGQRVRQSVRVAVEGETDRSRARAILPEPEIGIVSILADRPRLPAMPPLGVRRGAPGRDLTARERDRLRTLRLSHLRVDVRPTAAGWVEDLSRGIADAEAIGAGLEVALHVGRGAGPDLSAAAAAWRGAAGSLRRVLVYEAGAPVASAGAVRSVKDQLARWCPGAPVGGGTVGNFTELNRNRPPAGAMDVLAYPVNPQVHASDDLSLVENLQGQPDTVVTGNAFAGGAPLAVGPIILHRQPDPYAGGTAGDDARERVVGDARQRSAFGAAWTVGSLSYLAAAGAGSLTYYEATGPFGLMDAGGGRTYPLYDVFAALAPFAGGDVLRVESGSLWHRTLAVRKGDRMIVLIANLFWRDQTLQPVVPPRGWRSAPDAPPQPPSLPGYGVLRLDFVRGGEDSRA